MPPIDPWGFRILGFQRLEFRLVRFRNYIGFYGLGVGILDVMVLSLSSSMVRV